MSFVFPELPSWLLHDTSPPIEYVRYLRCDLT